MQTAFSVAPAQRCCCKIAKRRWQNLEDDVASYPQRFEQLDAGARQIKPDGLALGRFRAHIPVMSTIVQCCGAEYRRAEDKFLVPHTGEAICTVCDATLESWCESTHVPSFELIKVQTESRND